MKKANKGKPKEDEKAKNNWKQLITNNLSEMKLSDDRINIAFTKLDLQKNKLEKPIDILNPIITNFKYIKNINLSHNYLTDFSICILISSKYA